VARILVIDDDDIMNNMIVQMLFEAGYEAEGARDGNIGLKLYASRQYDLVVTDIVMPEKEGIETILAIRKASKSIPIIAISGGGKFDPDQYLNIAKQFGANYIFAKPFHNREFLEIIKKCLP
jgi:DNA-binding response OmpR family regulator